MSVKLRMTRAVAGIGRTFASMRLKAEIPAMAASSRSYRPTKGRPKQLVIDMERVKFWLAQGAIPSETVAQIIIKQGVACPWYEQLQACRKKAATIARKAGKPYGKTEKTAAAISLSSRKKAKLITDAYRADAVSRDV
jgi:ribosomal protein S16